MLAARSQSTLEWWKELAADIEAVDWVFARQKQAAMDAGQSWPPVRHPAAQPEAERAPQPGNSMPERPEIIEPEADHDGEYAARLDELHVRADEAAARAVPRPAVADGADVIHVAQEPAEADGVAERGAPQLDRGLGHPVQHLGG
jgi:hypothetical protein